MHPVNDHAPSLADTVAVLRRRFLTILVVAALVTLGALGWAQYRQETADAVYSATHTLAPSPSSGDGSSLSLPQAAIVVNQGTVAEKARAALDGHPGVEVRATANDEIFTLSIRAEGADPEGVENAANTYATTLLAELTLQEREVFGQKVRDQEAALSAAQSRLADLERRLADRVPPVPSQAELAAARSDQENASTALTNLRQQADLAADLVTLNIARASPEPLGGFAGLGLFQQILLALAGGLALGVGGAFTAEALDKRITSGPQASEALNAPILTEVPYGGKAFVGKDVLAPPGSSVSEAYRRLRTILQLERAASEAPGRATVVMVVSPGPAEGKTTTAAHLAAALGETNARVLVVSADFRRPRLHRFFGADPRRGIAAAAARDEGPRPGDLVQETALPNVRLVTAGGPSDDPTALIRAGKRIVAASRGHFDYIVIDTAPLLSANDALDFVSDVDAVVAVVRSRHTNRHAAERVRDILERVNAPVLGVVVTAVPEREGYGYYYRYQGKYGDLSESASGKARGRGRAH